MNSIELVIPDLDGKISKHYGGYLPEGYYHVVLRVEDGDNAKSYGNAESGAWELCILDISNKCYQKSPKDAPAIGAHFNPGGVPTNYKLTVASFKDRSTAEVFKEILIRKGKWNDYEVDPSLDFVSKSDNEIEVQKIISEAENSFFDFCKTFEKEDKKQTQNQKIVQSLISKNSTKITKLEAELKEARELQKILKGVR